MILTDYEKKIILEVGGASQPDLRWGAAMGAAIEFLKEDGLITVGNKCKLTSRGQKVFDELNRTP